MLHNEKHIDILRITLKRNCVRLIWGVPINCLSCPYLPLLQMPHYLLQHHLPLLVECPSPNMPSSVAFKTSWPVNWSQRSKYIVSCWRLTSFSSPPPMLLMSDNWAQPRKPIVSCWRLTSCSSPPPMLLMSDNWPQPRNCISSFV